MKRVILFFFLFLGLLQVSFAQNDKLVPLSVYPSVKNVASLIRSINKKLLPFKGRVASKSLVDLLGYIDSGSTYDSDESEADKAKSSPTDDAIFYVSETNKSAVLSLLNIAKEQSLYDTIRYRILLSQSLSDKHLYNLHVIDLKSPSAIPFLSFTNVRSGMSRDGNPVFLLNLTRDAASAFTKLTYDEVDNNIVFLLYGEFLTSMFVNSGVSSLKIELPQEMSADKAEEVVRHLNSSAVSEASLAPLYRAQYVIGDTLTYRFTAKQGESELKNSHTFQLIPRLVNDKITRIECIPDISYPMYEEAGKSDKAFQEIIDQARYLFRKNSVMIETDLSTHTTVSKLKDQEAFSKGMESYLIANADQYGASKEEMKMFSKQMVEELLDRQSSFFSSDNMALQLPELTVMTVLDNFFLEGQTQGTCYFPCVNNLVDYTITNKDNGYVIALKSKDKNSPAFENYVYYIDKQGLIQRVEYQWTANPKAKEKSESGADGDGYSFLIERVR